MRVATTLLMKCTLIGIRILSVFKYNMHMHIPNRNALVIPPTSWPIANMNEEISIAGRIPVLIFNRLNNTPLNTSSSMIGAKIMAPIASRMTTLESTFTVSTSKVEIQVGSASPMRISGM